jgi:hypothetical protein
MKDVQQIKCPKSQKLDENSLQRQIYLIYSTEVSLFLIVTSEHIDAFVSSRQKFKSFIAV